MEQLFTKEVIDQILTILQTATEGSIIAVVFYFSIPIIMLLISALAYATFGVYTVKSIKSMVLAKFGQTKVTVNETKVDIGGKFITHNGDHLEFIALINKIKGGDTYISDSHTMWLTVAVENQLKLDQLNCGNKHRPHTLKSTSRTGEII